MRTLEDCRKELDELDNVLIDAYLRRLALSKEIGCIKEALGMAIYDKAREEAIIRHRTAALKAEQAASVAALYCTIFKESKRIQAELAYEKRNT